MENTPSVRHAYIRVYLVMENLEKSLNYNSIFPGLEKSWKSTLCMVLKGETGGELVASVQLSLSCREACKRSLILKLRL